MKKTIISGLLMMCVLFLIGCEGIDISEVSKEVIICNQPYIRVGTQCCLDNNNNSICDKDEKVVEIVEQKEKAKEEAIPEEEIGCTNLQLKYKDKEPYEEQEIYTATEKIKKTVPQTVKDILLQDLVNRETVYGLTKTEVENDDFYCNWEYSTDEVCDGEGNCYEDTSILIHSCTGPEYEDKEVQKVRTVTKYRDVGKTKFKKICGDEVLKYCKLTTIGDENIINCPVCEETTLGIKCPTK